MWEILGNSGRKYENNNSGTRVPAITKLEGGADISCMIDFKMFRFCVTRDRCILSEIFSLNRHVDMQRCLCVLVGILQHLAGTLSYRVSRHLAHLSFVDRS